MHLKKHRLEQRCFLIEGPTAVQAALGANEPTLERIFSCADDDRSQSIRSIVGSANVPVISVDDRTMRSLSQTRNPQGIVAVARFFHRDVGSLAESVGSGPEPCLVVVLHDIADPGNAGTLMRSAEALGARAICCGASSVDPYNEKVVRASMGSIFHLPLYCYDEWRQLAEAVRAAALVVVAAQAGAPDVRSVTAPRRAALLVGHERHGLSAIPNADVELRLGIPQAARAESLNAAVAGSIIMYEIARAAGLLPVSTPRTKSS